MAFESTANSLQTLQPGESVIFTFDTQTDRRGYIYHRQESGLFRLASPALIGIGSNRRCCCCGIPFANYLVDFHANISLPTGGTPGEISLAVFQDGEEDPSSLMAATPAAVGDQFNVGAGILVQVPWVCRCASVSVRNTSTQAINVQNANIRFAFDGISR